MLRARAQMDWPRFGDIDSQVSPPRFLRTTRDVERKTVAVRAHYTPEGQELRWARFAAATAEAKV
jgi:hypothetical protein